MGWNKLEMISTSKKLEAQITPSCYVITTDQGRFEGVSQPAGKLFRTTNTNSKTLLFWPDFIQN